MLQLYKQNKMVNFILLNVIKPSSVWMWLWIYHSLDKLSQKYEIGF